VLPPRPAGLLALLDALPEADVVVLDHQGLDRWPRLAALARDVPLTEPVSVWAKRCPRSEIPVGSEERTAWLDQLWIELDEQVGARTG
jgi:hypothetical protein